ncbi:HAD hydrolase family protein [Alphaproteobacteria bacterium]|nr:HAD hydrolase family protein [Alphaproteobacteria bacterium]
MKKIKLSEISTLFLDFDGVLTDNKVFINELGLESVVCNRSDSLYLEILRKQFLLKIIIISTEKNVVVKKRAQKLNVECFQNIENKADFLKKYKSVNKINKENLMYLGNDINDLGAMIECKYKICPSDSSDPIKKISNIVLKTKGGQGVISEIFKYTYEKIDYSLI